MLGIWKAPLYVTEPTMDAMKRVLPETLGKRLRRVETIQPGQHFTIGDIDVHAFAIPHDAADPIGFTFRSNGAKMAIVTDLGYMPELVKVHLRGADCLVLESNHDLDMLRSEEHTSELQSQSNLVCRLLLEKKKHPKLRPCALSTAKPIAAMNAITAVLTQNGSRAMLGTV